MQSFGQRLLVNPMDALQAPANNAQELTTCAKEIATAHSRNAQHQRLVNGTMI